MEALKNGDVVGVLQAHNSKGESCGIRILFEDLSPLMQKRLNLCINEEVTDNTPIGYMPPIENRAGVARTIVPRFLNEPYRSNVLYSSVGLKKLEDYLQSIKASNNRNEDNPGMVSLNAIQNKIYEIRESLNEK